MSIFGKIKDAIFGHNGPLGGQFGGKKAPEPTPRATAPAARPQTPAPQTTAGEKPAMPQMQASAATPAPQQPVDVEAVLTDLSHQKGDPNLNWRSSIVDLMKLLDLDSSLANRKELATELGYAGAKDGSADMNIWLHKAVMQQLAKSGGTVPASLTD